MDSPKPVRVSQQLKMAVLIARSSGRRQYDIARAAGLHEVVMSRLVHDVRPVRANDPRVIAIGAVLGLTADECFAEAGDRK